MMCIGWKPSEFRSSRDQRTNFNQSKPEDIMDAEVCRAFRVFITYDLGFG